MELNEEKNLENSDSSPDNTLEIFTSWIKVGQFKTMKQKFENRVDGHTSEQTPQYLSKKAMQTILQPSKVKGLAFVYILKSKGGPISVVMMGTDENENLIFSRAFESSPDSRVADNPILEKIIKKGMNEYASRMENSGLPFDPKRDRGVTHEKPFFYAWIKKVREETKLFFGVGESEFQNVMFVGDNTPDIDALGDDDNYAVDVGNMCCPE